MYVNTLNKVKGKEMKVPTAVTTIVEKEEREVLSEIGWREHMTTSQITRKAIQEYISAHAEGNDTFKLDQFQDPTFKIAPTYLSHKDKWKKFYEDSSNEDRTQLRIKAMELQRTFREIDINEEKKS